MKTQTRARRRLKGKVTVTALFSVAEEPPSPGSDAKTRVIYSAGLN